MQGSEAIHVLGGGVTGGQGQQLAHQVGVGCLHGQVQRGVALLLLGAGTVQQLGHRLNMPILSSKLQRCEAFGVLSHTHTHAETLCHHLSRRKRSVKS